jgi:hypothetical protein
LQGYFHGILWYYLLAVPFFLGSGHPASFTWFAAIVSTLSVVVLKKLSGISGALLGTIIFSFAGFSVATAKFIWNPYPIVWLMPLYFLALYSFAAKHTVALPVAALLTSLMLHFEVIYGIVLLPTLLLMALIELTRHTHLKRLVISSLFNITHGTPCVKIGNSKGISVASGSFRYWPQVVTAV